jgi:FkbH-like protein
MNVDFAKIKLIIWDLDNTFWTGTITENEISPIQRNSDLIISLANCGIINSICSKNDYDTCEQKLKELNVLEYFVFPSINWQPKGQRIKEIIKSMALRPENVLFIDDEISNLGEAQYYLPELMVGEPGVIDELCLFVNALEQKDKNHSRLNQYKLLEIKNIEQSKYNNNEEFLYASNVQVVISEDCENQLNRIHELILRSNQLNFTKKRISIEDLNELLNNKDSRSGYVAVRDKFGDYGIVGFYAVVDNKLEHFLFSCRTIGLGVEQYVYSFLNCPDLDIVGEVVSQVRKTGLPEWINQTNTLIKPEVNTEQEKSEKSAKVLIKGPCDLSKSMAYIKSSDLFDYEFTYVNEKKGNIIEAYNHSVHIVGLNEYTEEQKKDIATECLFIDVDMLSGNFFNPNYDVIILSTLIESNYGIYKKFNSNIRVAFGSNLSPLTDKQCWQQYIQGAIYTGDNEFTEDYLSEFSQKYEFVGRTTGPDYIERIQYILDHLNKRTTLCLLLGVEFPCDKNTDPSFKDRHEYHAEINAAIRDFAQDRSQLRLIDLNEIVTNQTDFMDDINHFTPRVYYEISKKIGSLINEQQIPIKNHSSYLIYFDRVVLSIRELTKRILPANNMFYRFFKSIYLIIARKKK